MKTRFDFAKRLLAAFVAAALASDAAAVAAADVFRAHEADIVTNHCVAVGGYVFGVGRAVSRNGGDSVGFSKARILAFGKIADRAFASAPWPETATPGQRILAWRLMMAETEFALTLEGAETILERREAPEHYLAIIAIPAERFAKGLPSAGVLQRHLELAKSQGKVGADSKAEKNAEEEYEPRGDWEEGGVKANETMSDSQFL